MSVFGFSTEPSSGGDFLPIIKYDARAGRFFRVDRKDVGNGNFQSEPVDVTTQFKAIADFENVEVGWINFNPGQQPDFKLVPMGSVMPDRPSTQHKNGVRFMVKLANDIAGGKPIREVAMTSKAALSGVEEVFIQYRAEKDKHPGQLPVLQLVKTTPITTGTGAKSSTNYKPTFAIVAWMPRGDLLPVMRGQSANHTQQQQATAGFSSTGNGAAPTTGAQHAPAPGQGGVSASDFG